jgi:hypothetical protein
VREKAPNRRDTALNAASPLHPHHSHTIRRGRTATTMAIPFMNIPLPKDAILEYLTNLTETDDDNAFHSLIEGGEETVAAVNEILTRKCSEAQFKRFVEVLRELRIPSARESLKRLCEQTFSNQWIAAAEGLFYNHPQNAITILNELQHTNSEPDRKSKAPFILELTESLEP